MASSGRIQTGEHTSFNILGEQQSKSLIINRIKLKSVEKCPTESLVQIFHFLFSVKMCTGQCFHRKKCTFFKRKNLLFLSILNRVQSKLDSLEFFTLGLLTLEFPYIGVPYIEVN